MARYKDYTKKIYYDPDHPATFSDAGKLYRAVSKDGRFVLSRSDIERWLGKQKTHAVHAKEKNSNAVYRQYVYIKAIGFIYITKCLID